VEPDLGDRRAPALTKKGPHQQEKIFVVFRINVDRMRKIKKNFFKLKDFRESDQ
jgi:hypothetical protein